MVKKSDSNFIDGFSSVRALQHAGGPVKKFRARESSTKLPSLEKERNVSATIPVAKRISRSVIPENHDIICYECGYKFVIKGKLTDTYCPKCKNKLNAEHITIDKEWRESIKTIGDVTITQAGVIKGAKIVCQNLYLAGNVEDGKIHVNNKLELLSGSRFNIEETSINILRIRENNILRFNKVINCKRLELAGELKAEIRCMEQARIEKGGYLRGKIVSPVLLMDYGSFIKAKLDIGSRRK